MRKAILIFGLVFLAAVAVAGDRVIIDPQNGRAIPLPRNPEFESVSASTMNVAAALNIPPILTTDDFCGFLPKDEDDDSLGAAGHDPVDLTDGAEIMDYLIDVLRSGAPVRGLHIDADGAGDKSVVTLADILALPALAAEPSAPVIGFYVANGTDWDPGSKSGAVPYPVFYDGAGFTSLY